MSLTGSHTELIANVLRSFSKPVNLEIASRLDIGHLARIASFRPSDQHIITLDPESRANVNENYEYLEKIFNEGKMIYGVNTGFGGSANVVTESAEITQKALIQHLNCGIPSQTIPPGIAKALMLVRANSLSLARSGVKDSIIELLCDMIKHDIVPVIPLRGTVSSSGDLMCLSYIAATMNGTKKNSLVYYKGVKNVTAKEAFEKAGLSFINFIHKDGLAVVNSASCSATFASDNLFHFGYLIMLTQVLTAMTVEALHGRMESFDELVHETLSHIGMKEVCQNIRTLLDGSQLVRAYEGPHSGHQKLQEDELAQDRYGLRTSPQWLSPVVETYKESVARIRVEINCTCDNPLIDDKKNKIVHGGNFQGVSVTVSMDQTRQGVQMCGRLLFAQVSEVLNDKMNLILPPNLSGTDHTKDFGFKGVDTALASYTSELDSLAPPMTNHILSAEMHNQSVNSMALVSSRKTKESLDLLKLIIASSLTALVQALDFRWLRVQILNAMKSTFELLGIHSETCEKKIRKSWYEIAFRFDAIRDSLDVVLESNSLKAKPEVRLKFFELFKERCSRSVQKVQSNEQEDEVMALMGKGTRRLYSFVRKELGVKFYKGEHTLDDDCSTVHEALDSDRLKEIILEVFNI